MYSKFAASHVLGQFQSWSDMIDYDKICFIIIFAFTLRDSKLKVKCLLLSARNFHFQTNTCCGAKLAGVDETWKLFFAIVASFFMCHWCVPNSQTVEPLVSISSTILSPLYGALGFQWATIHDTHILKLLRIKFNFLYRWLVLRHQQIRCSTLMVMPHWFKTGKMGVLSQSPYTLSLYELWTVLNWA